MSEERQISVKEFRRVMRYIRRKYPPLSCIEFQSKMMHTQLILSNEDGLVTESYVSAFHGDSYLCIILTLYVKKEGEDAMTVGETTIKKEIFSLNEFIEIESKAEQLTQFTKSLNLWKH